MDVQRRQPRGTRGDERKTKVRNKRKRGEAAAAAAVVVVAEASSNDCSQGGRDGNHVFKTVGVGRGGGERKGAGGVRLGNGAGQKERGREGGKTKKKKRRRRRKRISKEDKEERYKEAKGE